MQKLLTKLWRGWDVDPEQALNDTCIGLFLEDLKKMAGYFAGHGGSMTLKTFPRANSAEIVDGETLLVRVVVLEDDDRAPSWMRVMYTRYVPEGDVDEMKRMFNALLPERVQFMPFENLPPL